MRCDSELVLRFIKKSKASISIFPRSLHTSRYLSLGYESLCMCECVYFKSPKEKKPSNIFLECVKIYEICVVCISAYYVHTPWSVMNIHILKVYIYEIQVYFIPEISYLQMYSLFWYAHYSSFFGFWRTNFNLNVWWNRDL